MKVYFVNCYKRNIGEYNHRKTCKFGEQEYIT